MADDSDYQQTRSSNRTATGRMRGQGRPQPRPQYQPVPGSGNVLVIPAPQRPDRIVSPFPTDPSLRPRVEDPGMVTGRAPIIPGPAEDMRHYMFRQLVPGFANDWGVRRPMGLYDPGMIDEKRMTQPTGPDEFPLMNQPNYVPPGPTRLPMPSANPPTPAFNPPSLNDLFRAYYGG